MRKFSENFFKYIEENKGKDPVSLSFNKPANLSGEEFRFALIQIDARRKNSAKLGDFLQNKNFIFPDAVSAQQASHRAVAIYHNLILGEGVSILDMTAGLGIDSFTFAFNGHFVTSIELSKEKSDTLIYNSRILGLRNINIIQDDSITYLKEAKDKYDVIFVDPSRRDSDMRRVYGLHHSVPDVIHNQDLLLQHASTILIKASPLLDLTQTIKDFPDIKEIHVVGVKGECKEVLIKLSKDKMPQKTEILVNSIDLDNEGKVLSRFECDAKEISASDSLEFAVESDFNENSFILEPSSLIMKIAPWDLIGSKYNAKKLGLSSHLFITNEKPSGFPGRVTRFEKWINKKDRKSIIGFPASAISKNHPLSSDELRKTLRLKEGDQNFIYASRIKEKPVIFLTGALH